MHKDVRDFACLPSSFFLAPIHPVTEGSPLRVAVVGRWETGPSEDPFVLLREVPGSRVYLGAGCDAAGRILVWLELWIQTAGLRHSTLASQNQILSNQELDLRWHRELKTSDGAWPDDSIVVGFESVNAGPVLVDRTPGDLSSRFAGSVISRLRLCKDDALLERSELPPYSSSLARYLHDPAKTGAPKFWAGAPDVPAHPAVEPFGSLRGEKDRTVVFNAQAGFIRAQRLAPLPFEDYLGVLGGETWAGFQVGKTVLAVGRQYERLRLWTGNRQEGTCLLHGRGPLADRLSEILFLKLGLLLDLFELVRDYARCRRSPLLNLSPASFQIALSEAGRHFPCFGLPKPNSSSLGKRIHSKYPGRAYLTLFAWVTSSRRPSCRKD
jgi:hypothetical protein